jgi:hypothetical protein
MVKTAVIEIVLVKESNEVPNELIEQELLSYLNDYLNELPWQHKTLSVKVKQEEIENKPTMKVRRLKTIEAQIAPPVLQQTV